ncbi:alkylhydroperoxidase AhpD family core domain-containing protein [Catalinimonas alkaloidigena]|uniref:Alkylhydroperoxidase AhpD family core domain-containing protein n=1 Tax=Catalinimonas alkaloidigena TaxID=1075417 RepID=A0A1G9E6M0_9BACT|nr:carboxymuconolactone decarboxylase family protein [Catalinimonas alkaloidigena]SDK71741.1 alkylhydroperoxidase AhpD family core domain-containing protein [Catalinimonas alkaloidigena]
MSIRLIPVEQPSSPLMKLVYWFSRRQVGKVISPLKTIYARLPFRFSWWMAQIQPLEARLALPKALRVLLRIHVAQLNTCRFCIDIGQAEALKAFVNQEKFFRVHAFETSPQFTEAERAALRFATELTLEKQVSDATYRLCQRYFSEQQVIGIGWMVASEHFYNLMNLAFHVESDGLCQLPHPAAPVPQV